MRTFTLILLATLAMAMPARAQKVAQPRAATPASATTAIVAGNDQSELIHGLLNILNDAVITRLDAKVSLERASVQGATVRLEKLAQPNRNLDAVEQAQPRDLQKWRERVRFGSALLPNQFRQSLCAARAEQHADIQIAQRELFQPHRCALHAGAFQ